MSDLYRSEGIAPGNDCSLLRSRPFGNKSESGISIEPDSTSGRLSLETLDTADVREMAAELSVRISRWIADLRRSGRIYVKCQ